MRLPPPRLVMGLPLCALVCVACGEREALDPGAIDREERVDRIAPPSRATSRTVRCACDAEGGLHVSAPRGSGVTVPEDATHPAEAQIVLPDDPPRGRLRTTKSLGFIGDGKLTPSPSRGGPWNAPDGLLPPHRHHVPYRTVATYPGYPVPYGVPRRFHVR